MAKTYSAFFSALRARESSNDYSIVNTLGFLGAYQFGEAALVDLGFVVRDANPYDNKFTAGWTGRGGIDSKREFLNSPTAQDDAAKDWFPLLWRYLTSVGADEYLGRTVDGIQITASGLIAGAHLLGAGTVRDWLQSNGRDNPADAYGTSLSSYVKLFAAYTMPFVTEDLRDPLDVMAALAVDVDARVADKLDAAAAQDAPLVLGADDSDDRLSGGASRDILLGGSGADQLRGRAGSDLMGAGDGADDIWAGTGRDFVDGGKGRDLIRGGAGTDDLSGGGGADVIIGGAGNDQMSGNAGSDLFVFSANSGDDTVRDFEVGVDRIDLSDVWKIEGWRDLTRNHMQDTGTGVLIDWGTGSVLLDGLTIDDLSRGDFFI